MQMAYQNYKIILLDTCYTHFGMLHVLVNSSLSLTSKTYIIVYILAENESKHVHGYQQQLHVVVPWTTFILLHFKEYSLPINGENEQISYRSHEEHTINSDVSTTQWNIVAEVQIVVGIRQLDRYDEQTIIIITII